MEVEKRRVRRESSLVHGLGGLVLGGLVKGTLGVAGKARLLLV